MGLSLNEMRVKAAAFAREWAGQGYEKGQTQLFYRDFFDVFGVPVRRVAAFEEPVKLLGSKRGFIDLFWKGVLLVEQKSVGKNLAKAKVQALEYFPGLKDAEVPKFVLVSDFQTFELYDLESEEELHFALADLPKHVDKFGFITGRQRRTFKDQDPVNIKAAELVGQLHDEIEASGFAGHDLERFLVRLVFCLFADDTGIFEPRGIFQDLLERRTAPDGSDMGGWLTALFQALDTARESRAKTTDEDLAQFPYVNGELFRETLRFPSFNAAMRQRLIAACGFDWSSISPAIFGSLFQSVMNRDERRRLGAHYTAERNILKLIEPLFMDGLRAEFAKIKERRDNRRRGDLARFQERLASLTFFDPACGCGNFLVIAYRELRLLEIDVVRELIAYERDAFGEFTAPLDVSILSRVNVNQFYGIEIEEFPARIAETAMWMMDHILNNRLSMEFGPYYSRIPLKVSPRIVHGNALRTDWSSVLDPSRCNFVFGNPPFRGHQWRTTPQQEDMAAVWGSSGQFHRLDYVTCWFRRAAEYANTNRTIDVAFVATNSITQGEQCSILWPWMFAQGVVIHFAHRSFQWNSEARGAAAVHCVIIGMTRAADRPATIFDYDHVRGDPHASTVRRINGYLVDGPQYAVPTRSKAPVGRLPMNKGSQPTDGARQKLPKGGYSKDSNLLLDDEDRAQLLARDPKAAKWLRPFVGGDELISGQWRWCLWLKDADPSDLKKSPAVQERLARVRAGRLASPTESVQKMASYPTLFTQDRQPSQAYLGIPEVSSESRDYIPMAVLQPDVIASNKLQIIEGAPLLYFGLLTSTMHMAWMRTVAGRLESRYSYAPAVYNSFPWPTMTAAQETAVTAAAQGILDARKTFLDSGQTLDDLYDRDTMPPTLRKAHGALDRLVDRLYRKSGFKSERERVEFLFEMMTQQAPPLTPKPIPTAKGRRRSGSTR